MFVFCKICNCKTKEIFSEKSKALYHKCLSCDFIFKDDDHLISAEEEMERYNQHKNSVDDLEYVAYFKDFIDKAIIPYCPKAEKVLDFGSGPSPVLTTILERDYGFEKVDIYDLFYSPEKVYEGKKYDLIVSTEVVEHLKDPLKYFLKFKELLVDGGFLCIMTLLHPNDDDKFKSWWYINDESHISFYNNKSINKVAEKVGLKIVYSDNRRYVSLKR